MSRKSLVAFVLLVTLAAVSFGGYWPPTSIIIDDNATVPGSDVPFWTNGIGIVTRFADSTEFSGAGPNGCRIAVTPLSIITGSASPAFLHGFLYNHSLTVNDTTGATDSTSSVGWMVKDDSWLNNIMVSASNTLTKGAAAPKCTLKVFVSTFGAGLTDSLVLIDSLGTGAAAFDVSRLSWPDSLRKIPDGSTISLLLGSSLALTYPTVTFDLWATDSVP